MMSTPKYHCELAGEGIDYALVLIKCRYYRLISLRKRPQTNSENALNWNR